MSYLTVGEGGGRWLCKWLKTRISLLTFKDRSTPRRYADVIIFDVLKTTIEVVHLLVAAAKDGHEICKWLKNLIEVFQQRRNRRRARKKRKDPTCSSASKNCTSSTPC